MAVNGFLHCIHPHMARDCLLNPLQQAIPFCDSLLFPWTPCFCVLYSEQFPSMPLSPSLQTDFCHFLSYWNIKEISSWTVLSMHAHRLPILCIYKWPNVPYPSKDWFHTLCSLSHIFLISPRFCISELFQYFSMGSYFPSFIQMHAFPNSEHFSWIFFLLSCSLISLSYHSHLQPSEVEATNCLLIFVGLKGYGTWGAGLEQEWSQHVPKPWDQQE